MNGEAAVAVLKAVMRLHHDPHPWDDLWRAVAVEHPLRDEFWDERNRARRARPASTSLSTWAATGRTCRCTCRARSRRWSALRHNPNVRVGPARRVRPDLAVGEPARRGAGLVRPLAQGPGHRHHGRPADPLLAARAPTNGAPPSTGRRRAVIVAWRCRRRPARRDARRGRSYYVCAGAALNRPRQASRRPVAVLADLGRHARSSRTWTSSGDLELRLTPAAPQSTPPGSSMLQDVGPGRQRDRRHRRVAAREPARGGRGGQPARAPRCCPCRRPQAVPIGSPVDYRIPFVPNARRFAAGHPIRLVLTSDDQNKTSRRSWASATPPVGTNTRNTIWSDSELLVPVL